MIWADRLLVQGKVRVHVAKLMGREDMDDPPKTVTGTELNAFERQRGPGPSLDNFCVHLVGRSLKCPWNQTAARIFARDFLDIGLAPNVTQAQLEEMFMVHLITLKNQHERYMERGAEASQTRLDRQALDARIHRRRYVSRCVSVFLCMLIVSA